MTLYSLLLIACWIVFMVVWLVSALYAKPSRGTGNALLRGILMRIALAALVVFLATVFFKSGIRGWEQNMAFATTTPAPLATLGVVLAALGIAFAIWARVYLGRNWGMPTTLREAPELVTSGPYRYVRHPIYTGVLTAIFGSALVSGTWWLVIFIAAGVYFVMSAYREERDMQKEFPEQYPQYMARTKMLVPFIF